MSGPELAARTLAYRIANGHAYAKHAGRFGKISRAEFEQLILETIRSPSNILMLPRDRIAYWSDAQRMVVVYEPSHRDAGTAFRPEQGKEYFLDLWRRG